MLTPPNHIFVAVLTALFTLSDFAQLVGLLVVLVTFLAVGRSKRKDSLVADAEKALAIEEKLHEQTRRQLEGAQQRADTEHDRRREVERHAAKLEGQIEELRPYGDAFKELSARIERTESVLGTAMQQHGELVMETTAVASQSVKALEQVAADLGTLGADFSTLAQRLGAIGERPPGSA